MSIAHPILTCKESEALEKELLGNDPEEVWGAIRKVGKKLGAAILEDYKEIKPLGSKMRILILARKGNNAGDAFWAAIEILHEHSDVLIQIVHIFGKD